MRARAPLRWPSTIERFSLRASRPGSDQGQTLDNLTHGLVGAALSKAGADRATPLATATLIIAANAPDIDVAAYARGEYFALSFRRGITHGWPALIVLPFLVAAAVLSWDRLVRLRRDPTAEPARAGPILALSVLGLVTHPMLDWMNIYGVRWARPFREAWSYGDALFIIDPWIWLMLGGALLLGAAPRGAAWRPWVLFSALASALVLGFPIGFGPKAVWIGGIAAVTVLSAQAVPSPARSRSLAQGALGMVVLYIALMVVADFAGRRVVLDALAADDVRVDDLMLAPVPGNPFEADLEISTPEGFVPGRFGWFHRPRVAFFPQRLTLRLAGPGDVTTERLNRIVDAAVRHHRDAAYYRIWSRYPYVEIRSETAGWAVSFRDARYDDTPAAGGLGGITVRVTNEEVR